ncbi:MAG: sucrose-6-phosphate hydrolase [Corynebacterium sp.]|nr:sucrose-6-phosphate hydrolase [Corynebacterium sp.]
MSLNQPFTDHNLALSQAEAFRAEMAKELNPRWYPEFHIAAPAGWINDPNGLCFFKGRYHAFYQHHPYGTQWGPMHWGHVSSTDLVHWKHEPIALAPSIEADRDGVFSGSAIVHEDILYVFYTGHQWRNGVDDSAGMREVQCLATSSDGIHFVKHGVVVDCPTVNGQEVMHSRDPKVWKDGDTWRMVFGVAAPRPDENNELHERGEMWMYESKDLHHWEFSQVLYQDPNPAVFMLECPDFFRLGDHWVLVYSPMGAKPDGYQHRNKHNAGYAVGTWEPGSPFNLEREYSHCDWGHNFYAPQTFAHNGRRILFGWMGSFNNDLASQTQDNWAGQLTLPRELHLDTDLTLTQHPVHDLSLNSTMALSIPTGKDIPLPLSKHYQLRINTATSTAERISLAVHKTEALGAAGKANSTKIVYDTLAGRVHLDRGENANTDRGYRSVPVDNQDEILLIDVFVDRGSVEVFVNNGRYAMSSFDFPPEGEQKAVLSVESGSASITIDMHL